MSDFNGLGTNLHNLYRLSTAKSRSISAENFTGEKGKAGMSTDGPALKAAGDLGQGWKISPYVLLQPGTTFTIAEMDGPGAIQSMWFAGTDGLVDCRHSIIRIYWDGQDQPSVECPIGDFFASGWSGFAQISSVPVAVNPNRAFNFSFR